MIPNVPTKQLLTSGILEAYLLGLTADADQDEIRQLIAANPDVAAHLHYLDADLENFFLPHAVPPPPAIRDVIQLRSAEQGLRKNEQSAHNGFTRRDATADTTSRSGYVDVEVDNTHIRVHKFWRPAFIAVFILSKVFLVTALYFYFKADSQQQEIARLKAETTQTVGK